MSSFEVRKWVHAYEETHTEGGPAAPVPLRKCAVAAVIPNPYAGRYADRLDDLLGPSAELAKQLVARAKEALGAEAVGCGKGAIVGVAGEQEHGVACLTTPFGDAMRGGIDGGTWVTSTTKVGAAGASLDVPLAHKRALFVRALYDTITVAVPDAPRPGEIVVVAALSSGGRVHERSGGLSAAEAVAGDGLR